MAYYHINPSTGRVGICRATVRECKFAKDYKKSGFRSTDLHFHTQEEAFQFAQEKIWKKKKPHKNSNKQFAPDLINPYSKYHELENLYMEDELKALQAIYRTEDIELLNDVFEGRLLHTDSTKPVVVAITNPNFPMEIKDHLVMRPDLYTEKLFLDLLNHGIPKEDFPFTEDQTFCLYDNINSQELVDALEKTIIEFEWGHKPEN